MPNLLDQFVHLGLGGGAEVLPAFTGGAWYEAYGARAAPDGADGRLVSLFDFSESWTSWEMHPAGAELVLCVGGAITLIQEHPDGRVERVTLGPGDYAINPPGVWHTADLAPGATARCVFITAGLDTQDRPR